jgi:hypothetical protein
MTDDYRVQSLTNQQIRQFAKKLRAYFGVDDAVHVDVIACARYETILTVGGVRRLNFQVRPDNEMGADDGNTIVTDRTATIAVKESVRDEARVGVGRARNTYAHEFGHAFMHNRPLMHRRSAGNVTAPWIKPFESAEHQAKVFAAAFLINDEIATTLKDAEQISVTFGVSFESANIYFEGLVRERDRKINAEKVSKIARDLANDFQKSNNNSKLNHSFNYMQDICTNCHRQTVIPLGVKFMCHSCHTVFDRFQDGDIAE